MANNDKYANWQKDFAGQYDDEGVEMANPDFVVDLPENELEAKAEEAVGGQLEVSDTDKDDGRTEALTITTNEAKEAVRNPQYAAKLAGLIKKQGADPRLIDKLVTAGTLTEDEAIAAMDGEKRKGPPDLSAATNAFFTAAEQTQRAAAKGA